MKDTVIKKILSSPLLALAAVLVTGTAFAGPDQGKAVVPAEGKETLPPLPQTLFPVPEFGLSIYGFGAFGNVDLFGGQTTVHETHTRTVAAPTTPTPPGSVVVVAIRPQVRTAVVAKAIAAPAAAADPVKTYSSSHHVPTTEIEHDAGGGGVEGLWFFSRYVGLAVEGDFLGGDRFVSQLTGQLVLRYPFEFGSRTVDGFSKDNTPGAMGSAAYNGRTTSAPTWGFAPYFMCGGGAQWADGAVGVADVGGGVEFRWRSHWGIFGDGRYFIRNAQQNFAGVRLGVTYDF